MSEQFKVALQRAIAGAIFSALVVIGPALTVNQDAETTLRYAAQAAIGYIVARGVIEGWYDTRRQEDGDVHPSDVSRT